MTEIVWKDIPGFEGLYSLSNKGDVRNHQGKVLKPYMNNGSPQVALYSNKKVTKMYIRLLLRAIFNVGVKPKKRKKAKINYASVVKKRRERKERAKRKIFTKERKLNKLREAIIEFSNWDVKDTRFHRKGQVYRDMFHKYAIEDGITGGDICRYIGIARLGAPSEYRKRFTKSFKSHPENLAIWHRFRNFIKIRDEEETKNEYNKKGHLTESKEEG